MPTLTEEELNRIKNDRGIRSALARESHYWFFSIYLGHYLTYPFAPFHYEMFDITENNNISFSTIVAFRGSGKSTIMGVSFPTWAVVGKLNKKFVLIVSQTQAQAKLQLANIKKELEGNNLLKADIGPFEEFSDEWGANSIVISNYGARITAVSTEQSIRGIRHGAYRPDLIICDDVEDSNSVKTREGRDKTFNWFNSEVIPVGDKSTKIVIVGNLLHEDSLIMRLKRLIEEQRLNGTFLAFPLLDEEGNSAWLGKYPTQEDLETLRRSNPSESIFAREYLLIILPDEDQVVQRTWLHFYKELPDRNTQRPRLIVMAVDPAISDKDTADYTGVICAYVYGYGEELKIYIIPHLINKRLNFPQSLDEIQKLSVEVGNGMLAMIYVEAVGIQASLAQMLVRKGCSAEEVKLSGGDKRTRLSLTTPFIKSGKILFSERGLEELINQLVGFGSERHDDLVDAFSLLIIKIMQLDQEQSGTQTIYIGGIWGKSIFDRKF